MTSQTTSDPEEGEISIRGLKRIHSDDAAEIENWPNKHPHESVTEEIISEEIKLRVVRNFNPKQMNYKEKAELNDILDSKTQVKNIGDIELNTILEEEILPEFTMVTMDIGDERRHVLDHNERHQIRYKEFEMINHDITEHDIEVHDWEDNEKLKKLHPAKRGKQMNSEDESMTSDESNDSDDYLNQSYEDEVYLYKEALTIKRGDELRTIPPANIGDRVGWWMVRHLETGKKGYIPRFCVVIENCQQPSKTTLSELPLELLDLVLENSLSYWLLNSSSLPRNGDVIKALTSVDFCWFQRTTRRRFKKRFSLRMKDFYGKTKKRSAIMKNNRNYLLDNIQSNDELIASLLSLDFITEEQSHLIQRQRSKRDKNGDLLRAGERFDDIKFSYFVKYLQQTNHKTVARILENGGGAIKLEVRISGARCTASIETQLLHNKIEDLRSRTKPRSHQTDKLISQLREEGIEILNSQLDRQSVVVWIWCHSQAALEHMQNLYESNQLRDVYFENIQPFTSKMINIDINQFKKTVFSSSYKLTNLKENLKLVFNM